MLNTTKVQDVIELTEQAQQDAARVIREITSTPDLIERLTLINKRLKMKNRQPEYKEVDDYLCAQLNSCAIEAKHELQSQTWHKILKLRDSFKNLQDIYIAIKHRPDSLINKYNAFYKLVTKNNGIKKDLLVVAKEYITNTEEMPTGLIKLYDQLNLSNHKKICHKAREILNKQIKDDVKSAQSLFRDYQALYEDLTLKDATLIAQKEALEHLIKEHAIEEDLTVISDKDAIMRANNLNTLLSSSENTSFTKAKLALQNKIQAVAESVQTLAALNEIPVLAIRLHTMLEAISLGDRASISAHSYDDIYQHFCEKLNVEIEKTKSALQDEVYEHIKEVRLKYSNLDNIYQAITNKNTNLQSDYNKFVNLIVRENGIEQNLLEVTEDIIKNPDLKIQDLLILAGELRVLLDAEDSLCSIIGDKRDIYNIDSIVRLYTNLRADLNFQIWQDLQKLQEQYTNYIKIYNTDYILPNKVYTKKQELDNLILQYTSNINLTKANEETIHTLSDEAAVILVADLIKLSANIESATTKLKAQLEAAKLREEFGNKFKDLQAIYTDLKVIFNSLTQPPLSLQGKYAVLEKWIPAHIEIDQDLTMCPDKLIELVKELDKLLNDPVYVEARTLLNNQIVADIQMVATEYNNYIELYNKLPDPEDTLTADKQHLDALINNSILPLHHPIEITTISALSVIQAIALITDLNQLIIPGASSIVAAKEKLEINIKEREDARADIINSLKHTAANRLSNEKIQKLEVYLNQLIGLEFVPRAKDELVINKDIETAKAELLKLEANKQQLQVDIADLTLKKDEIINKLNNLQAQERELVDNKQGLFTQYNALTEQHQSLDQLIQINKRLEEELEKTKEKEQQILQANEAELAPIKAELARYQEHERRIQDSRRRGVILVGI